MAWDEEDDKMQVSPPEVQDALMADVVSEDPAQSPQDGQQRDNPDDPDHEQGNRITGGNGPGGSLEQLLIRASTTPNMNQYEKDSAIAAGRIKEELMLAQVQEGVNSLEIADNMQVSDTMLAAGAFDIAIQAEEKEIEAKKAVEEAKEKEAEEKKKKETEEMEKEVIAEMSEIVGLATGASVLMGTQASRQYDNLPEFLKNVSAIPGMSKESLAAASSAGSKLMDFMEGYLSKSQSMGGEALCVETSHGLSQTGKTRNVEQAI